MSQPLNIVFISSWFPTRDNPTLGNFVESHAKASACYNNVRIIHVAKSAENTNTFELEGRASGAVNIQILYYKQARTGIGVLNKLIHLIRYFIAYNKLFSGLENKPDAIHANVIFPVGLIAVYFRLRYKIQFVLTEHWSIYQAVNRHRIGSFKKPIFKYVARKASQVMPVSKQLAEAMQEVGLSGNYKVVPNTIDNTIFKYQALNKPKAFQLVHISTLVDEVKNPKGILKAYRKLLEIRQDVHLSIISDGDLNPSVNFAREIGISKSQISFLPTQTPPKIAEILNQSHAFVLFSNYENLPLVILESFACGLPVISTNVGGIKERFPKGFGILINKGDEDALLEAMQNIISNYESYDSKKMSQYALDNFSYQAVGRMFDDVYRTIIKKQKDV